jgi:hypothetical protein
LITGYEMFAHGPYSAVEDEEANPFYSKEETWERQRRFSYTSTPVSALTDGSCYGGRGSGGPVSALADEGHYGGGLLGVGQKGYQRSDSYQEVY